MPEVPHTIDPTAARAKQNTVLLMISALDTVACLHILVATFEYDRPAFSSAHYVQIEPYSEIW